MTSRSSIPYKFGSDGRVAWQWLTFLSLGGDYVSSDTNSKRPLKSLADIFADTGEVTLAKDTDFETQSTYSFIVVATDAAGNTSLGKPVSLNVNNLDEVDYIKS